MRRVTWVLAALLLISGAGSAKASIINGSFETGDFTGWVTSDLTTPFFPLSVQTAGSANTFGWPWSSTPTNGLFTAFSGFDGDGPGVISIGQDVAIPVGTSTVSFDWRAAWDLLTFSFPGAQNRTFDFNVQPAGGGSNLASTNILTALVGTINNDTGPQTSQVDVSAFGGQTVRLSFDLTVPNNFSGPAQFQLDNIQLVTVAAVPEPATLAVFGLMAAGAFGVRRRMKATA